MPAVVDPQQCDGRRECITVCSVGAIEIVGDVAKVDDELCTDCGDCVNVCPSEAISMT